MTQIPNPPRIKATKPQSSLQRLQSLANWTMHFRLQDIHYHDTAGFIMTKELKAALLAHTKAVFELRRAVRNSYQITRMHILRERKKKAAWLDENKI